MRLQGDWEEWLEFFLTGVAETAEQATTTARRILDLFERDRRRVEALGRTAGSTLRVHELMRRHPLLGAARAGDELGMTPPTVNAALRRLEDLGMVREITGRKWGRLFAYEEYLGILNEGTEPL